MEQLDGYRTRQAQHVWMKFAFVDHVTPGGLTARRHDGLPPLSRAIFAIAVAGTAGWFATSCASAPRAPVEIPRLPMGFGEVAIDAVTNDADQEAGLRISPDGKFLLFNVLPQAQPKPRSIFDNLNLRRTPSPEDQFLSRFEQNAISLIELGKPGRTVVAPEGARDPTWFPDSRSFAFSMLQGRQAMLATSVVGQGTAAVRFVAPTPCVAYDREPSVSPDGRTVLFTTSTASDPATIATMDLKGSETKCKLMFPGQGPSWAPTGRKVVFTRTVGGHAQVFTFDEPRNLLTQVTFGSFDNFEPAWSPDGSRIVFVSGRTGTTHLFVVAEDGGSLVQLTQGQTSDRSPTWSRDGSIYFVSNAGGQTDIWRARFSR